ncbi:MAG: pantetheine-phosphate adenylyltransferase [Dehalococcoidia bacterium]|nr:pantetheine-phosphate adenylyltransferase [Chloroflexota bacterium]MCK4222377.1 pantetheine-phosphate adenylyltransferase [Dehalococcoidia bacterium]
MTVAVYPGSIDPMTNGHLDVIRRASALFDRLIVAIYDKPEKHLLFSLEERVEMAKEAVADLPNVCVKPFSGLVVDFAREMKAQVMVRGLRANSDFEREFEMALMNKTLAPDLELVCLMTSLQYQFLSSSVIKEVARLGGCLEGMVPNHVATALKAKVFSSAAVVAKDAPRH